MEIQWPKIFPEQATKTMNSSLVFMKQLTLVAVSTITYVKNALPETSYSVDNKLAGIDIRLLKSQCDDDLGKFLYRTLMNAFEALEKKFLKQLVLCFYKDKCAPQNLIEYYLFEYDYSEDGVAFTMSSKARGDKVKIKCDMLDVKKRTVMMVRTCLVMVETFPQLPEPFDVSIMTVYNDKAPEGYQAPGFSPASHLEDPLEAASFEGVRIGAVESPFHRMTLYSYTNDVVKASRESLTSSKILEDEQLEQSTRCTTTDNANILEDEQLEQSTRWTTTDNANILEDEQLEQSTRCTTTDNANILEDEQLEQSTRCTTTDNANILEDEQLEQSTRWTTTDNANILEDEQLEQSTRCTTIDNANILEDEQLEQSTRCTTTDNANILEDEQLEQSTRCTTTDNLTQNNNTNDMLYKRESDGFNCVCRLVHLDWPMLTCYYCSSHQHAACSGVMLRDMALVVRHCCMSCAAEMPSRSTDTRLVGTQPEKRIFLAILRCALSVCSTSEAVSLQDLMTQFSLNKCIGVKLLKGLMNSGIVDTMSRLRMNTLFCIDQRAVRKQMKVYFQTFDANIVEETVAEQEIQPDPIAKVLGPVRQVSLKNASNIGRVVKPQDRNYNTDDLSLNKYKEALQSVDNNDMEMPPSGSHNPVTNLHKVGKKRKNDGEEKTPSKKTKRMGKF